MKKTLSQTLTGLVLLAGLAASGCGNEDAILQGAAQDQLREFILIPNSISDTLTVKAINLLNGSSTLVSNTVSSGGTSPSNLKTCPGRALFFVANAGSSTLAAFSIDGNGGLNFLGSQAAPAGVTFLAVHPSGAFVYAGGGTALRTYAVQSNGTLTQVGGDITLAGNVGEEGAFSNGGNTLHLGEVGVIESYTVNPTTGSLSAPVATALGTGADFAVDLSVSPGQNVLEAVVRKAGDDEVRGYPLSGGTLGAVTVNALPAGTGVGSCDFARNGQFFVGCAGSPALVRGYNVATSGALTEFANSPATNPRSSFITALDPTNIFLFSLGGTTLDVSSRLADGTFATGGTSDSDGIGGSPRFDFFQYIVRQ